MSDPTRPHDELLRYEREAWSAIEQPPAGGFDRLVVDLAMKSATVAGASIAKTLLVATMSVGLTALAVHAVMNGSDPTSARVTRQHVGTPRESAAEAPELGTDDAEVRPDTPVVLPETRVEALPRPRVRDAVTPRLPTSTPVAPEDDGLGAELALVREAQLALRNGRLELALERTSQHASRFPDGILAPERQSIERRARCLIARRDGEPSAETCPR